MNVKIKEVSFHRNGICGEGFYAILFEDEDEEGMFIASLFDEPGYCAVYSVAELGQGNILFANGNSWRGDRYADALWPELNKYPESNGTNRMGPFAL